MNNHADEAVSSVVATVMSANDADLMMSLRERIVPGLASIVVGNERGRLTRFWLKPRGVRLNEGAVNLHTHRYDLTLVPISGGIMHVLAKRDAAGERFEQHIVQPDDAGGRPGIDAEHVNARLITMTVPLVAPITLAAFDIHSVYCLQHKYAAAWWAIEGEYRTKCTSLFAPPGHVLDAGPATRFESADDVREFVVSELSDA